MPPKRNAAAAPKASQTKAERPITPTPQPVAAPPKSKSGGKSLNASEVLGSIWQKYVDETPQRTKLIDVFMAFLVVVGILQFVYCVIVGNYVCGACTGRPEQKLIWETAFQRFPVGIFGDGWAVRPNSISTLSDQCREQGGVQLYLTRKVSTQQL